MDRHRRDCIEQAAADRLLRSADVLLAAREQNASGEEGASDGFVDIWVGNGDGVAGADRPFCYEELVEGMCFLIRCGLVEPAEPTGSRARSKPGR